MFFKERYGSIGDLMRSYNPSLVQSNPNWKIDLMKRSPDEIPLTDFFGSDLKISPIYSSYQLKKKKKFRENKIELNQELKNEKKLKNEVKFKGEFSFSFEKEFFIISLISLLFLIIGFKINV